MSGILKLLVAFGASGLAALTPDVISGSVPTQYVGIAGVVFGVAYAALHYLEQKQKGQQQGTMAQAVEAAVANQIPAIVAAVAALTQKQSGSTSTPAA